MHPIFIGRPKEYNASVERNSIPASCVWLGMEPVLHLNKTPANSHDFFKNDRDMYRNFTGWHADYRDKEKNV